MHASHSKSQCKDSRYKSMLVPNNKTRATRYSCANLMVNFSNKNICKLLKDTFCNWKMKSFLVGLISRRAMQGNHWNSKANQLQKWRVLDDTKTQHSCIRNNGIFSCCAEGMLTALSSAEHKGSPLALTWMRPGHCALIERNSFTNIVECFQSYNVVRARV